MINEEIRQTKLKMRIASQEQNFKALEKHQKRLMYLLKAKGPSKKKEKVQITKINFKAKKKAKCIN